MSIQLRLATPFMKTRRHHNNKGYRQIKRGKTVEQVKGIAKKLGIPYGDKKLMHS